MPNSKQSSMDFFDVLERRASVRAFLSKEVEKEKLERILQAANSAPSAGNLQAYRIIVVKDSAQKKALAEAAFGQGFIAEAPIVLVFFADAKRSASRYAERGKNLYSIQDATIACSYVQLSATALGIASVWVGAFDEENVAQTLGMDSSLRPVAILPLGYAAEKSFRTSKRKMEDSVSYI